MRQIRWVVLATISGAMIACGSTSSSGTDASTVDSGLVADAGQPDSGTVDSGTPDSGTVDAGTPDSGTADSGTPDAGMADAGPKYSCTGIGQCLQSQGFSISAIQGCEGMGTTQAANLFTAVVECAIGCAQSSDAGGCVQTEIGDGGMCESQWNTCAAQGPSCGAIMSCIEALPSTATQTDITNCVLTGNATAVGLAQDLVQCVSQTCSPDAGADAGPVDAGANCTMIAVSPGGACATQAAACASDMSGNTDGGM